MREGGAWSFRQRLKNDVLHVAIVAAVGLVRRLPRRAVQWACDGLARAAYHLLRREREAVFARLAQGLRASPGQARVRAAFREAGALLADTLALLDPAEPAGASLALEAGAGRVFREALEEGRGVIFVSAHLGSWERMAALLVEEGFPVATVARESYDPRLTRLYEAIRAPRGVRSIYRGRPGAAMAVARELRAGRAVGFLLDLPSRVPTTPVTLFGAAAGLPLGPLRVARTRGAAVVVGTAASSASGVPASPDDRRNGPARCVRIVRVPTGDLPPGGAWVAALAGRISGELEARIAERPEAWLGLFGSRTIDELPRPADRR